MIKLVHDNMGSMTDIEDSIRPALNSIHEDNKIEDYEERGEIGKHLHCTVRENVFKCNQGAGTSSETYKNDLTEEIIRTKKSDRQGTSQRDTQNIQGSKNLLYQKRSGASGVSGQLYETKLLTLVLLRAINDTTVGEFYLGTNISGIGALDDICLRYNAKENNKDVILFIQAKHRNDAEKGKITMKDVRKDNGDFSLAKYFDSYLQIRDTIMKKSGDVMFQGNFKDLDCYFIIYTPAKHNIVNDCLCYEENDNETSQQIRTLIQTDDHGDIFQLKHDDVGFLTHDLIENRVKLLAKIFMEFIFDKNKKIMDGKYEVIQNYHVVLAQNVIKISDESVGGSRKAKIRPDFFNNHERFIGKFRDTLYCEAAKRRPLHPEDKIGSLLFKIHENQTAENISKVIGNHIDFDEKSNRFLLIHESVVSTKYFKYLLQDKQVNPSIVKNAIEIAGREYLLSLDIELPDSFGNMDIAVRGNTSKVEKRLIFLATELLKVIDKSTTRDGETFIEINENIVGPNKLLQKGVVELNGGLASAVGNLLIYDEYTSMLKFNDTGLLPINAQKLWDKLKNCVSENDLLSCRFKFCIHGFPKVSFADDCYERSISQHFIRKLWFYTGQAKEDTVENIAKNQIDKHFKDEMSTLPTFRVKTDALFLKIHDEIQKWWMQPDKISYFTQSTDIFSRAMSDIVDNPLVTVFNLIYMNQLKTMEIEFEADAIKALNLETFTSGLLMIITDSSILTGAKLIQHYKMLHDRVFIDFNYLVSFTLHTLECILSELETLKIETLIITLEVTEKNNESICDKLNYVLNKLNNNKIIIVTNKQFQVEIHNNKHLSILEKVDETSLNDLSSKAQQKILNETMVIFQGTEVNLETIIDDESKHLIKADTLSKLLNKRVFEIGKSLTTSNYDKIRPFYVHRNLSREEDPPVVSQDIDSDDECIYIQQDPTRYPEEDDLIVKKKIVKSFAVNSLQDLKDDIVVVTATPGMGKSTLLTHLSLETKKQCPKAWIARINLLDYSKQFNNWQQTNTVADEKETIRFLCKAVTKASDNHEFEFARINNEIVQIRDIVDAETLLELNFFLFCYKNGKIIFLFDGFDEICPHYEKEVIQLMKTTVNVAFTSAVETNVKQKVWITSRSYNNVKHIIEREFGKSYTLQTLSKIEQRIYLEKFWKKYMNLKEFTNEQFANIDSFINYMSIIDNRESYTVAYVKLISKPLHNMYVAALEYIQNEIKSIPLINDRNILRKVLDFDATQPIVIDKLMRQTKNETKALTLSGTPLHIHIAADYFQSVMKHNLSSDQTNKWDLDMNTFAFYERFFEMKLMKIRFEEKNDIDVCRPDNKILHDIYIRKEFIEEHKKLAFYAMFKDYNLFHELITEDEIQEIKDMVENIKFAKEKTGVIDCVVEDVPRFVHRIFAEYFAVEYICDLLKTAYSVKCLNRQETIWKFLFISIMNNGAIGAFNIFDHKLANDNKLAKFLQNENTERIVTDLLLKQTSVDLEEDRFYYSDDETYQPSIFKTALDIAVENGLLNTARFLMRCVVKHLNENNMEFFVCLLTNNKLIHSAIVQGFDDIIDIALDNLKRVDKSKMFPVLWDNDFHYRLSYDVVNKTNSEIIKDLYLIYNYRVDLKIESFYAKLMRDTYNDEYTGYGYVHKIYPSNFHI